MTIELELITDESGNPKFLNFWDWVRADDICLECIEGKWYHEIEDYGFNPFSRGMNEEVSLDTFLQVVGQQVAANEAYIQSLDKQ